MSGLNYCFTDLPEFLQNQCAQWKKGGIDSIAIIDTDAGITSYSNATQWQNALADNNVAMMKGVKGEWADGSPVEGENPIGCGNDTILDGIDHVIQIFNFNVSADNDEALASVNGKQFYIAVRTCMEDEILVIERPVTIVALPANVPMSNKEKQRYNITLKFNAPPDWFPIRVSQPGTIFD